MADPGPRQLTAPAVVLTREAEDNEPLALALRERGVPTLEIACLATQWIDPGPLPADVAAVAFTSRRGVRGLLRVSGSAELLGAARPPIIAAVGKATARELEQARIRVDLVAEPPRGEVLAAALADRLGRLSAGARLAIVRGNLRAGGMDEALCQAGFCLLPVATYANIEPDIRVLAPRPIAAVLAASPSAARRLLAAMPWMKHVPFVAIGATTGKALSELGVAQMRLVGAEPHDWIAALCQAFADAAEQPRASTEEP